MTTIDTSKASLELDSWVADCILDLDREMIYLLDRRGQFIGYSPGLRDYSAAIVPAMEVVDKLIADGIRWGFGYDSVPSCFSIPDGDKWYAMLLENPIADFSNILAFADTLPLAICKALYKWKGEK